MSGVNYSEPVVEGKKIVLRDPLGDFAVGDAGDARRLARQLTDAARELEKKLARAPRKPRKPPTKRKAKL